MPKKKKGTFADREPSIDYDSELSSSEDTLTAYENSFPNYLPDDKSRIPPVDYNEDLSDEQRARIEQYLDDQHEERIIPGSTQNPEPVPDYLQENPVQTTSNKSFADQIREQSQKLKSKKEPNNDTDAQNPYNKGENWQQNLTQEAADKRKKGLKPTGHILW